MLRVGVLASGSGTNFQALHDACATGYADAEIVCVVTNKADAGVLLRAGAAGVEGVFVDPKAASSREGYDGLLLEELERRKVELVCGAGYLRILSAVFIASFPGRALNIHPSLLPSFPGLHAVEQAWEAGVKVTGVTVHVMSEDLDAGPIVCQRAVEVTPADTLETLERKVHLTEYALYPKALRLFAEGGVRIEDGRVIAPREVPDPPWAGGLPPGLRGEA